MTGEPDMTLAGDVHPPDDVLADLLADTLDDGTADYVTAHVMECVRCTRLLSDAERAGTLARAYEPGPMPDAVFARITAALDTEREHASLWAAEAPREDAAALRPRPMVSDRDGAPGGPRLLRRPQGPQTTRRQARDEAHEGVVTRMRQRVPDGLVDRLRSKPVLAAASAVLVLSLGGGVLATTRSGGSTGESASTAAAGADSAALTIVTRSGADYTAANLTKRVAALVAAQTASAPEADTPAPLLSGRAIGNATLTDPAALRACLAALDAGDARPLAVDLGSYEGRAAAVIVLPGRAGGVEVWAVARDCRPGADGTLVYRSLPTP